MIIFARVWKFGNGDFICFFFTCGIYPTRFPGTPLPFVPGLPPKTHISPVFNLRLPTIQLSNVVLPQPEAPSNPYLEKKFISYNMKMV